jgi:chemosensory pili system protein ChpA (sensor histidine kinase/response regulator)
LEKIKNSFPVSEKSVSFSDKAALLKILMENEQLFVKTIKADLEKYLVSNDSAAQQRLFWHFKYLESNVRLAEAPELSPITDYFLSLFESDKPITIEKKKIDKLDKSYDNLIRLIAEKGTAADIDPLLSEIKTLFVLPEVIKSEAPEKVEETGHPAHLPAKETLSELITESDDTVREESGEEEDLDEIFKQESEKYISIIETALDELKEKPDNTAAIEKIEKSLHSLKSSSRLMGFNEVADLCGPFEKICEKLHDAGQMLNPGEIDIFEEILKGLKTGIAGESLSPQMLIDKLSHIKVANIVTQTSADKEGRKEDQLFADSGDEDEDLLNIFKEESREYIAIVENATQALAENLTDREALGQLENATHSLKTAAKMLGFSEIGELADGVEAAAVAILRGEIKNHPGVLNQFSEAIKLIKEMTSGQKQNSKQLDKVLAALNIHQLKENEAARPQSENHETITFKSPELDDQTQLFIKEGWELLEKINRDLLTLEKNPANTNIIANLNRNIHTLKGSAQILNFKQIGELAHKIEDVFVKSRKDGTGLSEDRMDAVFKVVDVIQELIKSIKAGSEDENPDVQNVLDQINFLLSDKRVISVSDEKSAKPEQPLTKPKIVGIESEEEFPTKNDQFIKITTENLDKLINMAAELVINKTQLNSYLDKLRKIGETIEDDKKRLRKTDQTINSFFEKMNLGEEKNAASIKIDENVMNDLRSATDDFKNVLTTFDTVASSFRSITRDFEQNIGQISSLSKSLHDDILQVRLVPTELLFNRYPRAVRDMAKKLHKKVNLVVEGEQTEMDRALIESLTDPVMHLVRNAIDHGLESPEERAEQGKSEDGILLLKARRSKNQIIIEVQDDGRGIDPEKVKKEILKQKLANKEELNRMTPGEVLDYVFRPGFSTRQEASDVSGRGVGLDVVASQIQKLKGDLRLSSTPGRGTIFSIRVPLTLAIAQAIMVKIGNEILAIPLSAVEETLQFKDPELVEKDERAFISLRDQLIPVAYLSSLLDYGDQMLPSSESTKTAIIVREAGSLYGLIVDQVLGREEIVIKSLGEELAPVPYISGGTISGDGSVILILDIPSLTQKIKSDVDEPVEDFSAIDRAREILSEDSKKSKFKKPTKKKEPIKPASGVIKKRKISGRSPVALIVDDSVSVRKFVSSVLEKNKYATILAEDGPEALDELEKNEFDIIITDLEMPKMQGFDLIAEIRKHRKFESIPIVILTGRAGKKHRDKGSELGANAYITKPFKESDLLNTLEEFITIT